MAIYEHAIEVNVPVRVAYNQWTQFETFPAFMDNIEDIIQEDDDRLLWKANIMGIEKEWHARITEQEPDTRIAWTNIDGATNAGVVTFHYIDENTTRVMLQMEVDPEGFVENVGEFLGIVESSVSTDLQNFKVFIEAREEPTGAWRGEIQPS